MRRVITTMVIAGLWAGAAPAQIRFGAANTSGSATATTDTATLIADLVARLTTLLNLTTAQAAQATTIFTNAENTIAPLETTLTSDATLLQTAIKNNNTSTTDPNSIPSLATQIGSLEGQILNAQSTANAAFYAILTSSQQAQLQTIGVNILCGAGSASGIFGITGGLGLPGPGGRH